MENLLVTSREKIDSIDQQLTQLFLERMNTVRDVAKYKEEHRLPVLNSKREREVIAKVTKDMSDEMAEYTKMLFMTMFDLSRSYQEQEILGETDLQEKIKIAIESTPKTFPKHATVACQGIEGANSSIACDKLFSRANIMYMSSFDAVFRAVDSGLCEYGVLPIENSLHGSVTEVYDLMKKYHFHISRSAKVKIDHTLLAKRDTNMYEIREIFSHPQAIAQCDEFLKTNKNIKVTECENTAIAAQIVANSNRRDIAAIASKGCSELYNLDILSCDIQNSDNNHTRFICISKNLEIYPGADKISLMFTIPHRPGALYSIISKFSALGVNMSKLESRPIPGLDFEFMFYIDLDANINESALQKLLSQLENSCEKYAYLGSYREI